MGRRLNGPIHAIAESLFCTLTQRCQVLDAICKDARTLWDAQKKHGELSAQIETARKAAGHAAATKSLGQAVRDETIRLIKDVEPQTKKNFEILYNNDILEFDMLTTGHAANPELKKQLKRYSKVKKYFHI